jgi:hypothetical protein
MDDFLKSYIITALWSTNDESTPSGGVPLNRNFHTEDIHPDSLREMELDCMAFQRAAGTLLKGVDLEQAGHDFWLTRNGHGVGFWDRDMGPVGERLTELCKFFGECNLYVGDDGKIHIL